MRASDRYDLVVVRAADDWTAYHDIREAELFAARGSSPTYDRDHPDETAPDHFPLLLKFDGTGIGTTRLDLRGADAVIRLVAIARRHQRKGHGRVLNGLVEAFARDKGVRRLLVNAAPEAVGFYDRLDFRPHAWAPEELQGIAADCVQMAKAI